MNTLFTVEDPLGRTIILEEGQWLGKINIDHPGMKPDWAAECLTKPAWIAFDADYANRRAYYKKRNVPRSRKRYYMKVVIQLPSSRDDPCRVITAFLTMSPKREEKLEWPGQ